MSIMNVATALNKQYLPYTTIMLTSLCLNNDRHIDAYLFNSELNADDLKTIKKSLFQYDITITSVFVDKEKFNDRMPRTEQWSLEAYYRLLMFELIPASVDRMLYLDGDIIVNKDILDYYDKDFDGAEIFVCDDKSGLNVPESYGNKHREMFEEAYKSDFRYFNSGVLLLNLRLMRNKYSFATYLDAMEKWNYEMEAPDQDILNYVHWKNVKYVDCQKYDLFARIGHNRQMTYEDVKSETAIIHYTGYKPWESGNFHFDIEKIWWEYAQRTMFYKELLENFVQDEIHSSSVANYIRNVEEEYNFKKHELSKKMHLLEIILNGKANDSNEPLQKSESYIDSERWDYGYLYTQNDIEKMAGTEQSDNYVEVMETFLDSILFDARAENYVISLRGETASIDEALKKADEILNTYR